MATIVTRAGKGSALTYAEADANFTNLNTSKIETSAIGTTVQPYSANLVTLATVAPTAAGLALLDDADASAQRTTLGLGTISTQSANSVAITGGTINGTTVGETTPSTGSFTSLTDLGNLSFTGTGNRITGDFSNATLTNRVAFQTSTTNGNTIVTAIPNGTGTTGQYNAHNNSDIGNSSFAQALATATEISFRSTATGTGTFLPMTFHTNGSEQVRIDTSGNVGIGKTPNTKLDVNGTVTATEWAGGGIVTETVTQTLTNKTVNLTSNSLSGTKAQFDTACSDGNFVYTDAIGVSVQAYDADLVAWAGVATTAKQDTLVSGTNIKTINGSSVLGAGDLVVSSSIADGDKGDITVSASGATWTIDNSAVTTAKLGGDITTAGKALLDDIDAAAQRTTLGLGTLATQNGTFSGTTSGTNTGDQNLFSTIVVAGQTNVVADTTSDSLTLVAGANVTITTDATTDTITIAATGGGGGSMTYPSGTGIAVVTGGTAWGTTLTAPSGTIVGTTDTQTLTNKTLTDPTITGTITEDIYTITDGAAFAVDPSNGSIQLITLGASRTPVATNFLAGESITLMVDDGSAFTLTWTDTSWGGSGVIWETNTGNAPSLSTTGYTTIVLWKVGSQVYGARVGDA